jgi:hypothetical protein
MQRKPAKHGYGHQVPKAAIAVSFLRLSYRSVVHFSRSFNHAVVASSSVARFGNPEIMPAILCLSFCADPCSSLPFVMALMYCFTL